MKFLVILICLGINYLWLRDFDRFDDRWFFTLRSRLQQLAERAAGGIDRTWLVSLLLIYAIPMLLLWLVIALVAGQAFGLLTMAVHILVLLVAFDRTQPGRLASDFLVRWKEGDLEACVLHLQEQLGLPRSVVVNDEDSLGLYFSKQFTYRCFERMFVMLFWYMVTGPLGVLFSYISYQLRDDRNPQQPAEEARLSGLVINVLEWLPLRLLALTFSLAGNFVRCFDSLKRSFWQFGPEVDTAELLYGYASSALAGGDHTDQVPEVFEAAPSAEPVSPSRLQQAAEIGALQALLERSQVIWLSVLALITILELQVS